MSSLVAVPVTGALLIGPLLMPATVAAAPDGCMTGYVAREALSGDTGCVATETATAADRSGAVLGLINQQRSDVGCGPLSANEELGWAAARHANDILGSGVEGHDGSDGSTSRSRISDTGYAGTWAEIVYWGSGGGGNPQAAVDWWMNSPGHRAIMLNCEFTTIGVSAVSADEMMTSVGVFGVG